MLRKSIITVVFIAFLGKQLKSISELKAIIEMKIGNVSRNYSEVMLFLHARFVLFQFIEGKNFVGKISFYIYFEI